MCTCQCREEHISKYLHQRQTMSQPKLKLKYLHSFWNIHQLRRRKLLPPLPEACSHPSSHSGAFLQATALSSPSETAWRHSEAFWHMPLVPPADLHCCSCFWKKGKYRTRSAVKTPEDWAQLGLHLPDLLLWQLLLFAVLKDTECRARAQILQLFTWFLEN